MKYGYAPTTYREQEILGSSRERLVVLLYEQLLLNLTRAAQQIERGDIEGKAQSLDKASAIVFELLSALDAEVGGELASRLAALYSYLISEISDIGRTMSRERLERATGLVRVLHESWAQAAQDVAVRGGG